MASSTNNDIADYYTTITTQSARIIPPILYSIGNVGIICNFIVFAQKTMRQNPASTYFIAFNIANAFSLLTMILVLTVPAGNSFDLSVYSVPYCKIRFYFLIVFPTLSKYYLVMAAIDRTLVTSSNVLIRLRSTHRLAYWSITGVTVITLLFDIHLLINVDIYQQYPGRFLCYTQPGNYSIFYTLSNLVINGFIPWILLITFAILTLKNLNKVRIKPVNMILPVTTICRSRDRQFAVMLLAEIATFILSNSMSLGFGLYLRITQYQTKNTEQKIFEQFLQTLFLIITFIYPAISFYLYLVVSKAFRQKTIEVLCKRYENCFLNGRRT